MRINKELKPKLLMALRSGGGRSVTSQIADYDAIGQWILHLGDLPGASTEELREWVLKFQRERQIPLSLTRLPKAKLADWELEAAQKLFQAVPGLSPLAVLLGGGNLTSGFFSSLLKILENETDAVKQAALERLISELQTNKGLFEVSSDSPGRRYLLQEQTDAFREVVRLFPGVHLMSLLIDFGVRPDAAEKVLRDDVATSDPERQALLEKLAREQSWIRANGAQRLAADNSSAPNWDKHEVSPTENALVGIALIVLGLLGLGFLSAAFYPKSVFGIPGILVEYTFSQNQGVISFWLSLGLGLAILVPVFLPIFWSRVGVVKSAEAWIKGFFGEDNGYIQAGFFIFGVVCLVLMVVGLPVRT